MTSPQCWGLLFVWALLVRVGSVGTPCFALLTGFALVQASFEAAQLPPVHQTKPGMKALKVLPGQQDTCLPQASSVLLHLIHRQSDFAVLHEEYSQSAF